MNALRFFASVALLVIGAMCVALVPSARWTHDDVLDREGYVRTVEPLSRDMGVQDVVIAAVEKQVMAHLDVSQLTGEGLPVIGTALNPAVEQAARVLVHQITTTVVRSSVFPTLWNTVVRDTHPQVVYVLTGRKPARTTVTVRRDGLVLLELAPVIEQVRKDLVAAGMVAAAAVPALGATIEVARLPHLGPTRAATRTLDAAAGSLLVVGALFLAAGVAVATARTIAVAFGAGAVALGSLILLLALRAGRTVFVDDVGSHDMSPSTAHFVFDTSARHLHSGMTTTLVAALVVATLALGSRYARRRPQPVAKG